MRGRGRLRWHERLALGSRREATCGVAPDSSTHKSTSGRSRKGRGRRGRARRASDGEGEARCGEACGERPSCRRPPGAGWLPQTAAMTSVSGEGAFTSQLTQPSPAAHPANDSFCHTAIGCIFLHAPAGSLHSRMAVHAVARRSAVSSSSAPPHMAAASGIAPLATVQAQEPTAGSGHHSHAAICYIHLDTMPQHIFCLQLWRFSHQWETANAPSCPRRT